MSLGVIVSTLSWLVSLGLSSGTHDAPITFYFPLGIANGLVGPYPVDVYPKLPKTFSDLDGSECHFLASWSRLDLFSVPAHPDQHRHHQPYVTIT